jgi:Uma2 family endonuclease
MPQLAEPLYTAEDYLALERAADHKSEPVNGRIYAMTGASMPHNQIVLNVSAEIRARLRGGPAVFLQMTCESRWPGQGCIHTPT